MTTYSHNLTLDDRWAIELGHALKCYLSNEVQELIAQNPVIGTWGNTQIIRDIIKRQLNSNLELRSTNNFFESKKNDAS